ncbi:MAG: tRNA pseudouridine(38-40) synthase TruA [Schwartzia sp. (in: firmicutes)]
MRREHRAMMKARRRNIALVVAYDGTAYHGFQRQTPPVVAVQNVLEERLARLFGEPIEMAAAGRTDAGVHARGQVVNFFTNGNIPVARIVRGAESLLPADIVVREAFEVSHDFSALHSAGEKTYTYRLLQGAASDPFLQRYAWYIRRPLDVEAMRLAAAQLIGEHDFSSFRAAGGAPMSPIRRMYEATVTACGDTIHFCFCANGFLYHMVRNLVGTLVDVGLGIKTPAAFSEILAGRNRDLASATAPARGLCLERVCYPMPYELDAHHRPFAVSDD